jgi:hypothetical protein
MNRPEQHQRPTVRVRRVVGPHWIVGQRGRFRYAVRSFKIKTTVVALPYGGGGQ